MKIVKRVLILAALALTTFLSPAGHCHEPNEGNSPCLYAPQTGAPTVMERQRRTAWLRRSTDIITLALQDERLLLQVAGTDLRRWDRSAQRRFALWFGDTKPQSRQFVFRNVAKIAQLNARYTRANFAPAAPDTKASVVAYVHKSDMNTIFLGKAWFGLSAFGMDSRAGTLIHEMSHLVGNTGDYEYSPRKCLILARTNPAKAQANADNYQFYAEFVARSWLATHAKVILPSAFSLLDVAPFTVDGVSIASFHHCTAKETDHMVRSKLQSAIALLALTTATATPALAKQSNGRGAGHPGSHRPITAQRSSRASIPPSRPTPPAPRTPLVPSHSGHGGRLTMDESAPRSRPIRNPIHTSTGALNPAKPRVGQGDGRFGAPRAGGRTHRGIDIGTPVHPVQPGRVTFSGSRGRAGNEVKLQHPDGTTSIYMHLNGQRMPPIGRRVTPSDTIGQVGRSGNVPTGADSHLHLQILGRDGRWLVPNIRSTPAH